jgi:hypothetical protein
MTGTLFMTEKMHKGFLSLAKNWRFMMLRPDGATVGLTGGAVSSCAQCHAEADAAHDYLHFMHDEARLK